MKFNLGNNYLIIILVEANCSKIAGNLANKKSPQLNISRLVISRLMGATSSLQSKLFRVGLPNLWQKGVGGV